MVIVNKSMVAEDRQEVRYNMARYTVYEYLDGSADVIDNETDEIVNCFDDVDVAEEWVIMWCDNDYIWKYE